MANIIGRLTNNEVEILQVDAVPSSGPGTPAPIGAIAMYNDGTNGFLYLKIGSLDIDWDLINTNTASGIVNAGVAGRMTVYPANGNTVDDVYVQNGQNIIVSHVSHPTRTIPINYNIPNPGDSISSADFVLTEGAQTINGNKIFSDNVTVQGDLNVNGTLTYLNSTQTEITDKLITLNKGGLANSANNSGIEYEEGGNITGYLTTNTNRDGFALKAPVTNEVNLDLASLTANRTLQVPDRNNYITVGTGASGRVAFWSDTHTTSSNANFVFDNTNIRLGVGVTAPTQAIHTSGTIRAEGLSSAGPVKADSSGVLSTGNINLTSEITGILPIANGGTNSGTALNNDRIMVSSGGAIVEAPALTNGQLLIGSTGAAPVAANIIQTGSNSVVITNGPGSIQLDTAQDIKTTASPTFVNATLSGKTPGSVLFAGTGGLIEQDNANLFFDDTNNRLGIGTNTPVRRLDVNGSSILRGDVRIVNSSAPLANFEIFQAQVQTTDATITQIASYSVPTDSAVLIRAKIVGRRTGGTAGNNGDSAVYIRTARFKNVGGTVTIHNLQTDYTSEDQASWNGTMAVSGTNAIIRVVGAANNNIDWTVTYEVISLS